MESSSGCFLVPNTQMGLNRTQMQRWSLKRGANMRTVTNIDIDHRCKELHAVYHMYTYMIIVICIEGIQLSLSSYCTDSRSKIFLAYTSWAVPCCSHSVTRRSWTWKAMPCRMLRHAHPWNPVGPVQSDRQRSVLQHVAQGFLLSSGCCM